MSIVWFIIGAFWLVTGIVHDEPFYAFSSIIFFALAVAFKER